MVMSLWPRFWPTLYIRSTFFFATFKFTTGPDLGVPDRWSRAPATFRDLNFHSIFQDTHKEPQ